MSIQFRVGAVMLCLVCIPRVARAQTTGAAEAAPREYSRVVTEDAKSRRGFFTVHRIGSRLLFEIPQAQLGKDQLLVTEIAKTTLGAGSGGQAILTRVFRWERRGHRAYLRSVSHDITADSSRPEFHAVQSANVNAVVASLNVEAYSQDSAMVVDVTRLFTQPPAELGVSSRIPGTVDAARSWIESAATFPDNVNVASVLTFAQNVAPAARGGSVTTNPSNSIVLSWSFHQLPEVPMMPRYCDDRVGYFEARVTEFTDVYQRVRSNCFIRRYRLEKRNPSAALSDPIRPIVFYIDPATPTKWIPYFKRAIESWQPAFEAAGFSNAILAREAPSNDPDWSPEDARYSVVRWLPSVVEDASGPHVFDPRSGEVLSAHIQFNANAQKFLYSMYFLQAAGVDVRARSPLLPDSLMGRLLEYMLAHEVGHTLGFAHNMKASAMYPTDSLRSASFLRRWGHSPSIMDYSRFNYLVQPEDSIPFDLLMPTVGPYDIWATKWGYAPLGAKTPEDERATLDAWAREQADKPHLRFSTQGAGGTDPEEQTEAVGDADAVKATGWGLKNIRRQAGYLLETASQPHEPTDFLNELHSRLMLQWRWELLNVANIVGGATSQEKYGSQPGVRFTPIGRARQRAAVQFLNANAFATPTYFLDPAVVRRIEPAGTVARISIAQNRIMASLLQTERLLRMSEYSAEGIADHYTIGELLVDIRSALFAELRGGKTPDVYRRALQRYFVEHLILKLSAPPAPTGSAGSSGAEARPVMETLDVRYSDLYPAVRAELSALDTVLAAALRRPGDGSARAHIGDLRQRIAVALRPAVPR